MSGTSSVKAARWLQAGLWAAWIVLGGAGLVGLWQRLTQGHLPAGYGSYVPWGLWVALYFHGVGMAGGLFIIGALGYILQWPGFRQRFTLRLVIGLSVAAILPAFLGVLLDLGHMERFWRIFLSPSFTSMMAFNAWMYAGFLLVAVAAWLVSFRNDRGWLKPLLGLAGMLSVLFPSQSGAFFGVVDAKAFWHSALLPTLFLTSAVVSGAALLMVVRAILYATGHAIEIEDHEPAMARLRVWALSGLIFYFVLEFAEFSIALWNPTTHVPAVELVLFGPYWWVFWIVHMVLDGILPFLLLAQRRWRNAWPPAALLIAITFVSTRLNVLIPGQAVAEIQGLQEAFQHDRLKYIYHATLMEYLVGFLMIAFGMAVFYVAWKLSQPESKSEGIVAEESIV